MDFSRLASTVAQYAPLLGSILSVPGGEAIGKLIAHEFGGDVNSPDDLAVRIMADPQAVLKLLELQSNTKVQLQQLMMQGAQNELTAKIAEIDSEQKDRSEARKNFLNSWMPSVVTIVILGGFFAAFAALLIFGHKTPDEQVLYMMVGTISTAFGGAVTYWLGSSNGSRGKDLAIQNALAKLSV